MQARMHPSSSGATACSGHAQALQDRARHLQISLWWCSMHQTKALREALHLPSSSSSWRTTARLRLTSVQQTWILHSMSKVSTHQLQVAYHTRSTPEVAASSAEALRSVQTHISKQFRIEMCVCTLLKANPMGEKVRAHALKGKINFTQERRPKYHGGKCLRVHGNC